jgi:hypothetical protein
VAASPASRKLIFAFVCTLPPIGIDFQNVDPDTGFDTDNPQPETLNSQLKFHTSGCSISEALRGVNRALVGFLMKI